MYKITLYDCNLPSFVSGVFCIYSDDIDEFEQAWIQLESDDKRIEKFKRSKAGEMVTDYYSDDPALNIVQKDDEAKMFFEKNVAIYNKEVEVFNGYRCPSKIHIEKGEFKVRYVLAFGRYIRLVKFCLKGVCQDDWLDADGKNDVVCYGNSVLKNERIFKGRSETVSSYSENCIESIAYYPLGIFESEEEILKDYNNLREDFFTDEELDELFSDIPGEAG